MALPRSFRVFPCLILLALAVSLAISPAANAVEPLEGEPIIGAFGIALGEPLPAGAILLEAEPPENQGGKACGHTTDLERRLPQRGRHPRPGDAARQQHRGFFRAP